MRNYFQKTTILTLFLFILASFVVAQDNFKELPREEQLLNGLKVLIWSKPNTKKVSVSLRVHSGSAFDPQDKEGTVSLLSELLFPEASLKKYFEEDLEGKLEVTSNYDYIQIDASAKSDEFLQILQVLAPAVSNPQIDKKALDLAKEKRLEKLEILDNDPQYIADQAIAERLYGDFPYGRSHLGTKESLAKIDFADLIFARQRLLNADNATLIITGDVKSSYAYKASRRLLGGWKKSQKIIPSNFRLPEKPETTPLTINVDSPNIAIERVSVNAFSRRDSEFYATEILANVLDFRFKESQDTENVLATVKNNANYLRGNLVFSVKMDVEKVLEKSVDLAKIDEDIEVEEVPVGDYSYIKNLFKKDITKSEFETAKAKFQNKLNKMDMTDAWLSMQTYKFDSLSAELKKANSVSLNEVQKVATEIGKNVLVKVVITSVGIGKTKTEDIGVPDKVLDEDPKDPKK